MTTALILTGLIWICQNCQLRAIAIDTRVCDTSTLVLRVAEEPSFFSCCITLRSVCGLTEAHLPHIPQYFYYGFSACYPLIDSGGERQQRETIALEPST